MKVDTYACDQCGTVKQGTNHWHRVLIGDAGINVTRWDAGKMIRSEKHLCSDACVIKTVQQWLSAQQVASQSGGENNVGQMDAEKR